MTGSIFIRVSGTSGKVAEVMEIRRRTMLRVTGVVGILGGIAACGRGVQPQEAGSAGATSSNSSAGQAASTSMPTAAPSWRGALDIQVEPDLASRGFTPTSPQGEVVEADGGLKVTVPENSKVNRASNENGVPETRILLPGAETGFPRLLVQHVESFGRSLAEETQVQEVFLSTEKSRNSYVYRSREQWPGAKEAIAMSWSSSAPLENGDEIPVDGIAFWLADDAGGGWVLYAAAPKGEMREGTPLWEALFSVQLPA